MISCDTDSSESSPDAAELHELLKASGIDPSGINPPHLSRSGASPLHANGSGEESRGISPGGIGIVSPVVLDRSGGGKGGQSPILDRDAADESVRCLAAAPAAASAVAPSAAPALATPTATPHACCSNSATASGSRTPLGACVSTPKFAATPLETPTEASDASITVIGIGVASKQEKVV